MCGVFVVMYFWYCVWFELVCVMVMLVLGCFCGECGVCVGFVGDEF